MMRVSPADGYTLADGKPLASGQWLLIPLPFDDLATTKARPALCPLTPAP
jgi:hypothetical protein